MTAADVLALVERLEQEDVLWHTDMADGGYVAHGAAAQMAELFAQAGMTIRSLIAARDAAEKARDEALAMLQERPSPCLCCMDDCDPGCRCYPDPPANRSTTP